MKVTQGNIEGNHLVLTGPIQGAVTLEDGTTYDVSPAVIEVDEEHRAEVAALVGQRYAEEGHPDHWETDQETGERRQMPFKYTPPEEQAKIARKALSDNGEDPDRVEVTKQGAVVVHPEGHTAKNKKG